MEIETARDGGFVELRVRGMLDSTWAQHLSSAVDDVVRAGAHRVLVDLAGVTYLSSAGISALLNIQKKIAAVQGVFGACNPSPQVRQVLKLTGLERRLLRDDAEAVREIKSSRIMTIQPQFQCLPRAGVNFEVYDLAAEAPLECRVTGRPELLEAGGFPEGECRSLEFDHDTFGLGLGAFGQNFTDCQDRFGEFLAVAGAAAQSPPGTGSAPDYQVARADFLPTVQTLYGLKCRGKFGKLLRFTPPEGAQRVRLSTLAEECLSLIDAPAAGIVLIAESAGLLGAALKRAPVEKNRSRDVFHHPQVRDWLTFAPEQVHARSLALVVGIAVRSPAEVALAELAPFLRPMNPAGDLLGHFHGAVFSYRPVKKRSIDLQQTVATLFESEDLQAVLHLLGDFRPINGAGESEFTGGAAWVGRILSAARSE
jgi:anti-anti-sigma factor